MWVSIGRYAMTSPRSRYAVCRETHIRAADQQRKGESLATHACKQRSRQSSYHHCPTRKEMVRGDAEAIPQLYKTGSHRQYSELASYMPFSYRISPGMVAHAVIAIGRFSVVPIIIACSTCNKSFFYYDTNSRVRSQANPDLLTFFAGTIFLNC